MGTNNAINLKDQGIAYFNGNGTFSAAPIAENAIVLGDAGSNIKPSTVLTNGQILIGSTGNAPAAASLTSADGSITFTSGAGTITIEGTAASTTQVGSVELATSQETISGTDSSKAITAAGLNGKLGSQTSNGLPLGAGDDAVISWTDAPTDGQILIGGTGNAPALSTITAGNGISVTNGTGSITIGLSGSGTSWTEVTDTSQALSSNSGYIANNASLVTLTLPPASLVGDVIEITGKGAGGWKIAQNSAQQIFIGDQSTTAGVSGSLESTDNRDTLKLVCTTANVDWNVVSSIGNLTVV